VDDEYYNGADLLRKHADSMQPVVFESLEGICKTFICESGYIWMLFMHDEYIKYFSSRYCLLENIHVKAPCIMAFKPAQSERGYFIERRSITNTHVTGNLDIH